MLFRSCSYDTTACASPPDPPVLALAFSPIKQFDFSWAAVPGADLYQLLESASPGDPYVQLGGDLVGTSVSFEMPLHFRTGASYVLRACNAVGCADSAAVPVANSMAAAVGYLKASNTDPGDGFGDQIEMLAGMKWQCDAVLKRKVPAPHAAAVDDDIGRDMSRPLGGLVVNPFDR